MREREDGRAACRSVDTKIETEVNRWRDEIEDGVTEIKREVNRDTYVLRLTYC